MERPPRSLDPSGVGCFSKASGQRSLANRAPPGRGPEYQAIRLVCPVSTKPPGLAAQSAPLSRAEAERAFQLAERLGSVNAAAQELGTTWPSLRKAFTRHGLGMPTRNPEAIRQRAIAAASRRADQPTTPGLDPVFVALNPGALPARARPEAELYQWVRREEQYAILGANVVVELYSESHARRPTTRAWAIIRRADAASGWPANAPAAPTAATPTEPTAPAGPINRRSGR